MVCCLLLLAGSFSSTGMVALSLLAFCTFSWLSWRSWLFDGLRLSACADKLYACSHHQLYLFGHCSRSHTRINASCSRHDEKFFMSWKNHQQHEHSNWAGEDILGWRVRMLPPVNSICIFVCESESVPSSNSEVWWNMPIQEETRKRISFSTVRCKANKETRKYAWWALLVKTVM